MHPLDQSAMSQLLWNFGINPFIHSHFIQKEIDTFALPKHLIKNLLTPEIFLKFLGILLSSSLEAEFLRDLLAAVHEMNSVRKKERGNWLWRGELKPLLQLLLLHKQKTLLHPMITEFTTYSQRVSVNWVQFVKMTVSSIHGLNFPAYALFIFWSFFRFTELFTLEELYGLFNWFTWSGWALKKKK